MTSSRRMWPLLVFLLVGVADPAAAQTYRWVDEQGNPHYAGRRDQVPERYRSQLPGEKPGEPPKPRLPSTRPSGITSKVTGECTLRVRGTALGGAGVVVVIGVMLVLAALITIHPGHVGVSVKKCGDGGVSSNPIPTGYYWRSLFCEDVVEYPISVQTLVLSKNPHEGQPIDESITVTSSEGLPVNLDVSLSFTLDPVKVPTIYTKYRNGIDMIAHNFIRQTGTLNLLGGNLPITLTATAAATTTTTANDKPYD